MGTHHNPVKEAAKEIRQLKIQGARNVAIAAVDAIGTFAEKMKARNKKEFLQQLRQSEKILFDSRETEPLMRNAIRLVVSRVESSSEHDPRHLIQIVRRTCRQFLGDLSGSRDKIAEIAARRIRNGTVIFTHCHSSTVTNALRKAYAEGKRFDVICTETRPFLQGRITATEMLDLGVKTTLIVDSAARSFMSQADLVLVGADAITSEGNIINKIGTSTIALVAQESRKPFYVASELLKFDPATMLGEYEMIEERSTTEIWKNPPERLIIKNPAFDVTRRDFIHGLICEEGIISPHSITELMQRKYPWIFE